MRLSEMGVSSWGSTGHFPGGGAGSSRDTLIFFWAGKEELLGSVYKSWKGASGNWVQGSFAAFSLGALLKVERRGEKIRSWGHRTYGVTIQLSIPYLCISNYTAQCKVHTYIFDWTCINISSRERNRRRHQTTGYAVPNSTYTP